MTIGVITANMGRVPILKIFCAGIKRLRNETGIDIPVVCAGDIDGADVCREYDIKHIECPNRPLTSKFNTACFALRGKVDYVMVMGSDNIMATKTFARISTECQKQTDLIGLSEVYFFGMDSIHTGKLIHFRHTTVLGVGRTIKGTVLDKVYWQPWTQDKDRGIDIIMLNAIRPYVNTRTLFNGEFVVDLKTSMNLNRVDFWAKSFGYMPDAKLFWDSIGDEEATLVREFLV